jgi:hypothetical protein
VTKIRENDKRLKLTPLLFGHFRQVLNFTIFRQYFNNKKKWQRNGQNVRGLGFTFSVQFLDKKVMYK